MLQLVSVLQVSFFNVASLTFDSIFFALFWRKEQLLTQTMRVQFYRKMNNSYLPQGSRLAFMDIYYNSIVFQLVAWLTQSLQETKQLNVVLIPHRKPLN